MRFASLCLRKPFGIALPCNGAIDLGVDVLQFGPARVRKLERTTAKNHFLNAAFAGIMEAKEGMRHGRKNWLTELDAHDARFRLARQATGL